MDEQELFTDAVLDEPEAPPAAEPAAPAVKPPARTYTAKEYRALERQRDAAETSRRTADETARYWQQRGQQSPAPAAAAAAAAAPKEDMLEALTSGDEKRIERAIAERGFVKGTDVASEITKVRSSARTEALLERDYPGLKDNKSPMFQAAARIYQQLVAEDPDMANKPQTTLVASRLAEAELIRQGIDPRVEAAEAEPEDVLGDEDEEDEEDERTPVLVKRKAPKETETERIRRVASAANTRGKAPAARAAESTGLSAMEKHIVDRFREEGADIDEASFTARANAGVKISGLPIRGRR